MYQDWMEKIPVLDDIEINKCERCQNTYAECWIEYFSKKVGEQNGRRRRIR